MTITIASPGPTMCGARSAAAPGTRIESSVPSVCPKLHVNSETVWYPDDSDAGRFTRTRRSVPARGHVGRRAAGVGRERSAIPARSQVILAIDIGGTKFTLAAFEDARMVRRDRKSTRLNSSNGY